MQRKTDPLMKPHYIKHCKTHYLAKVFAMIILMTVSLLFCIETFGLSMHSNQNSNSGTDLIMTEKYINNGRVENIIRSKMENKLNEATSLSSGSNFAYPFFPQIYSGYGVDHMNINLVDLENSGLQIGDEIGVFDGIYCVGSSLIEEKDLQQNFVSIITSANDTVGSESNGYTEGHKIQLKAYRLQTVYQLFFQLVNNSNDVFLKGGSMFALVDFSKSVEEGNPLHSEEFKIYPNPFTNQIKIEINLPTLQELNCMILDSQGKLIRILNNGLAEGRQLLIWDGKNEHGNKMATGIYILKVNERVRKIILVN